MLHLAYDLSECGDVASEYVELVHQTQSMQYTILLPQNLDEKLLVFLLLTELPINQSTCSIECAQCSCGHLLDAALFFHQEKRLKNCRRVRLIEERVDDVEFMTDFLESLVKPTDFEFAGRCQTFTDGFENECVDLGHTFGDTIVTLHELFAGAPLGDITKSEAMGYLTLNIKKKTIFCAPGQ